MLKEAINARELRNPYTPPRSAKTIRTLDQLWAFLAPESREQTLVILSRVVAKQVGPPPQTQEATNDQ